MQRAKQLGSDEYHMIAGEFEDISTGPNGSGPGIGIGISGIVGQVFMVHCCL
ncbi:hypothetical protein ACRS6Y_16170 [Bacillus cytotoxicus]|uniref:Uncharacterized protein n=1 Tax=Bacillus cytotoxicus (strain DSM 22905 / CIP 110041 / 391-98 / NVH 391-98) TaxID=315749 RepID=A7GQM6_BACCN|nr:hypothetical protein [Bacillus cytotoxicus]ABS22434.1 hypothetical protein Bcer98_2183 [Bacillus cytotoxicus NVH 391-98]MDH2865468.1 hypothetical protein [Bacillus cytotoxicus]MDH2885296.1 hypothetical protein [Bacillus cytotoxicus]NZD33708.1 hypothetical protein [Bacillus cytotoxicus]QTR78309.1 hypothetical protein JC773_17705 [Bacillus cytotoxicus]